VQAVDTLKVKLSISNKLKKAQAPLNIGGSTVTVTLTSDDLAKACEQTFQPAQYVADGSDLRSLVTKAVEDARVHELVASDPKLLDNIIVFVAGGSGQLQYVPDQLKELGYKPFVFTGNDAQMAVVTGALQTALVKHGVYDNIGIHAFTNAAPYSIAVKLVKNFPGPGGHIVAGRM
jgi:molecular chaperone DnaK (HSP70)